MRLTRVDLVSIVINPINNTYILIINKKITSVTFFDDNRDLTCEEFYSISSIRGEILKLIPEKSCVYDPDTVSATELYFLCSQTLPPLAAASKSLLPPNRCCLEIAADARSDLQRFGGRSRNGDGRQRFGGSDLEEGFGGGRD